MRKGERLIISPKEYRPEKIHLSQEHIQQTIHDLIFRIETLRSDVLPNLKAALFDPTANNEERSKREKTITEIITRIERADHLVAEMEQYIQVKHAPLARLIQDERFKHVQDLVAIIEKAISEESLAGVLHEAQEHLENGHSSPPLLPDSFHPEWYDEADIEYANQILAVDIEELIGPDVELKPHVDQVVKFLHDPMVIVELRRRIDIHDMFQPASLLFIKEKAPEVWESLLVLLRSSQGKEMLLHILGRPRNTMPNPEEMDEYETRMYEKLPNVVAMTLAGSVERLESEVEGIRGVEHGVLVEFYGEIPRELGYHHESLVFEIQLKDLLQRVESKAEQELLKKCLTAIKAKKVDDMLKINIEDWKNFLILLADFDTKKRPFIWDTDEARERQIIKDVLQAIKKLRAQLSELEKRSTKNSDLYKSATTSPKGIFNAPVLHFLSTKWKRRQKISSDIEQDSIHTTFTANTRLLSQFLLWINTYIADSFSTYNPGETGMKKEDIQKEISEANCDFIEIITQKFHAYSIDSPLKNARNFYLTDCDLHETCFLDWDLTGAVLHGANVTDANFTGAIGIPKWIQLGLDEEGFYRPKIIEEKIRKREITDLTNINLKGVNLSRINVEGMKFVISNNLPQWIRSGLDHAGIFRMRILAEKIKAGVIGDVTGAYLGHIKIFAAQINGAKFERTDMSFGHLIQARITPNPIKIIKENIDSSEQKIPWKDRNKGLIDLWRPNFRYANLYRTDFSYSVLSGVDFSYADMQGADLSHTSLEKFTSRIEIHTQVKENVLTIVSTWPVIHEASIDYSTNFSGANLGGADFSYANIEGIEFNDRTNFEGANFTGAKNIPPEIARYLDENGIYHKPPTESSETPPPAPPTPVVPQS